MRIIDADALKEVIKANHYLLSARNNSIDYGMFTTGIMQAIDNAPTVENITIFCENADEKTIEELKAEMQKAKLAVFEERPQGEWTDISTDGRHTGWIACSVCGQEPPNESNLRTNFCPNCGAKMKGAAE